MLDFGFSEILLTSAIALVVLGPERLPKVARQVGNWMGRARVMARQLSEQLEREVNAEELLKERLNASVAEAPRPAHPAPVVPAKTPTKIPAAASKTPVSESPEVVLAMALQVTVERKLENEPAEWEKGLQMRLMELDVDPGHDCEPGFSNASGV